MKKKINDRCPLQAECERTCKYVMNEIECDYYAANAYPGCEIADQEQRRPVATEDAIPVDLVEVDNSPRLVNIPIDHLHPHPNNPRKNLGDLSELADSIKAKGVLQNLTVVPMVLVDPDATIRLGDDHYVVIIGHRRRAAAKLAGLTELPCVITDMTEREQIQTMLVENMQRSDLTVYEEAKGFQMMLDLGDTVEEVAEKTGFSQSTVRSRVKLADLDEAKFKKACERGATLFEFAEIGKIESLEVRNELMGKMGTDNFKSALKSALDDQKTAKKIERVAAEVDKWATALDRLEWGGGDRIGVRGESKIPVKYVTNFSWYTDESKSTEPPEDAGTRAYYYSRSAREIDIYCAITDQDREQDAAREAERKRERDKEEALRQQYVEISRRHYELRRDFILDFNAYKEKAADVSEFVIEALLGAGTETNNRFSFAAAAEMLGIALNEAEDGFDYQEFLACKQQHPERTMLILAYLIQDDETNGYWWHRWNSELRRYQYVYNDNLGLDGLYRALSWLGYHISAEESEMRNGTHKLLEDPNASEETEDDNADTSDQD